MEKRLKKMSFTNLKMVCKKMKISFSNNKKNTINKLLEPLGKKYKMETTFQRIDKLPKDIEKEIAKFFPNLTSEQALQRFGMLPEEIQRKILSDYSGLRNTSATTIQKTWKRLYIKKLIREKPPNGINSIEYILSSDNIHNINFDWLVNHFQYNPLYYINFDDFMTSLYDIGHMRTFVVEVVKKMASKHLSFININFSRVNLSGLNLRNAIFSGMTLVSTNFTGSDLRNTTFGNTQVCSTGGWSLFDDEPRRIILSEINFTNSDLRGSNLDLIQDIGWEDEDVLENIINKFNTCIFTNAKYNNETRFPRRFNPQEKGMILVE
jgi:hypothetical protein